MLIPHQFRKSGLRVRFSKSSSLLRFIPQVSFLDGFGLRITHRFAALGESILRS